jgi:hypothetical protein
MIASALGSLPKRSREFEGNDSGDGGVPGGCSPQFVRSPRVGSPAPRGASPLILSILPIPSSSCCSSSLNDSGLPFELQPLRPEVDEQPDIDAYGGQVVDELRLVTGCDRADGFDLDHHP